MLHVQYISIDHFLIEKIYPPSGEPSPSSYRGKLSLRCWACAWLNDCANGDEADFTSVKPNTKNAKDSLQLAHGTSYMQPVLLSGSLLSLGCTKSFMCVILSWSHLFPVIVGTEEVTKYHHSDEVCWPELMKLSTQVSFCFCFDKWTLIMSINKPDEFLQEY